ncbi:hypothetical protein NDU88_000136 [Pleurodeles waltl]|uniref:Uncharacterized protein n=1 Tax=Pleurodeles waltl TaxID=8319 RepID=A0AAV7SVH6_PLEWA|nr:hypothetical protein NDU88_000136 [Pleurodeles waltl]
MVVTAVSLAPLDAGRELSVLTARRGVDAEAACKPRVECWLHPPPICRECWMPGHDFGTCGRRGATALFCRAFIESDRVLSRKGEGSNLAGGDNDGKNSEEEASKIGRGKKIPG